MKSDRRYLNESGREIFTGNELLLKGALETEGGLHLLTGYPGSPISGFFDAWKQVRSLLDEKGIVARLGNNEALSMAMANGAQMAECRAMVAMKNVGVHVASDALALGVLAGTKGEGGVLVVCGDDPWSDSTQVPADSRYLAQHVRMPMLEPSTPQEVKDWVDVSFKLGRAGQIYIGYMMTVALADGGGSVKLRPNHYPQLNARQRVALSYEKDIEQNLDQFVLLPPRTWQRELTLPKRHAAVIAEAARLGVNRIDHCPQRDEVVPIGFIASGASYAYLTQALEEMGLSGKHPILKLGLSYPIDGQMVGELAARCQRLIVVEERRAFVETQVRQTLGARQQSGELDVEIWGKQFPGDLPGIPSARGLHPSLLIERLAPLLREAPMTANPTLAVRKIENELSRIEATDRQPVTAPLRTPTFCPGCPHRDSSGVLLELRRDLLDTDYMLRHHKSPPVDLVAHGDTGCYTMLMFEPNKPLMHNYSGMGLGGATGNGIDPFITNKQIVFMGDGTFFHSGQVAIGQSIATGQDITYIILENKTTAMTGHQPHSGVSQDQTGHAQTAIEIEQVVRGMVPRSAKSQVRVVRMNPEERDEYREALEKTILAPGVKIVIADKECGITAQRRVKAKERQELRNEGFHRQKQFMNIATEVCENCRECTTQTGCPGLKVVDSDYGPKIQTDLSWCVDDGACARIHACPSFEEVTVLRRASPRRGDEHVNLYNIPDAPRPLHADKDTWRCYLSGVGGMGIGTATAILVTAGHAMGYHVHFLDKKGLAIRNGGVFSQVVFTRNAGKPTTATIPYGKADLLLGVDMLEASRSIDPNQPFRVAGTDQTTAVVNTAKTPTILNLMGRDDFDLDQLEDSIRSAVHPECYFSFNVGDLCERLLESKLYANIMMLGMAYQLGYLPLHLEKIEDAVRQVVRHEVDRNMRAFHIGRKIVEKPQDFVVSLTHEYESARQALRRKAHALEAAFGWPSKRRGKRIADGFRELMQQTFRSTRGMKVDDALMRDVIVRAHDCVVWGGLAYARRYCRRLVAVFKKDGTRRDHRLTRAVVWNLAKVMLIKDEVYVSAMLTSPEKYQRDRKRFNVNPARGDRIVYRHYNRPEFSFFGQKIRFHWRARDWQLRVMARCRWLRKLMPGWHQRERDFRDWYEKLVDRAEWSGETEYKQWLYALSTPETVSGYREIRYPKQESARAMAEAILKGAVDLDEIENGGASSTTVSLSDRILHTAGGA
ncbi:MAG: 2-oxoacid:acceptor oxidoreductase family protein [Phycisphaeraceae bacterium]|nr:2-oxoacid:acceptor oxidoreductase family protein [Phycisphaeraceae bacterium]